MQDIGALAKGWAAAIFGGLDQFRVSSVPETVRYLLATFGEPGQLDFHDWNIEIVNNRANGRLIAVTTSHVIVVTMHACEGRSSDPDQLSAWMRPRRAISALEVRASPGVLTSARRAPGSVIVHFDDNTRLDLPLSDRADVPDMVRVLTPR